jgi:replicative DNA helicase
MNLYQGPGDSIAALVNPKLEKELLGLPMWLAENNRNVYEATEVVKVLSEVNPLIFFKHLNRKLLEVYRALSVKDLIPSLGVIQSQLQTLGIWVNNGETPDGKFNNNRLLEYLDNGVCPLTLAAGLPLSDYYFELLDNLQELYIKRSTIHCAEEIYNTALEAWTPSTPKALANTAYKLIAGLSVKSVQDNSPHVYFQDVAKQSVDLIDEKRKGEYQSFSVNTGFGDVDRILGGLYPGNLIILAGRPGMGKTAFALDVGKWISDHSATVVFFSFEMNKDEIIHRVISKQLKINLNRLRSGNVTEYQVKAMYEKIEADKNLFWVIDRNLTPDMVETRLKKLQKEKPKDIIRVIILDHLQIMGSSDSVRYESRHRQLASYTNQLKDLAKRFQITVVLLSQLNRNIESRQITQRQPRLSDLRESGSIEENADIVLGLWRKYVDTKNPGDRNHGYLGILKNRNGPIESIQLFWTPETASFSSVDTVHDNTYLEDAPF